MQLPTGSVNWLAAQEHSGQNIGTTDTRGTQLIHLEGPDPQGEDFIADIVFRMHRDAVARAALGHVSEPTASRVCVERSLDAARGRCYQRLVLSHEPDHKASSPQ